MPVRQSQKKVYRRSQYQLLIGFGFLSVAIVAAAIVLKGAEQPSPEKVAVEVHPQGSDRIVIPVPRKPVALGENLSSVEFERIGWSKADLREGVITDENEVRTLSAGVPLAANAPLYRQNLTDTSVSGNPIIEAIPEGSRAITIEVNVTAAVEGWAGSGAIVDVLLVRDGKTSVVAEGVKILSAERSTKPVDGNNGPGNPSTATLLVTQEQCLRIMTAKPLGHLTFALRGKADASTWTERSFRAEDLPEAGFGKKATQKITGYVEIKGQNGKAEKKFALKDDNTWIPAESKPNGFMVNQAE